MTGAEERRRARGVGAVGHQHHRGRHVLEGPGPGPPGGVPEVGAARVGPADGVGGTGLLGGIGFHAFEGEEQHLARRQLGHVDAEIGGGEELGEPAEPGRVELRVALALGLLQRGQARRALRLGIALIALGRLAQPRVSAGVLLAEHPGLVAGVLGRGEGRGGSRQGDGQGGGERQCRQGGGARPRCAGRAWCAGRACCAGHGTPHRRRARHPAPRPAPEPADCLKDLADIRTNWNERRVRLGAPRHLGPSGGVVWVDLSFLR